MRNIILWYFQRFPFFTHTYILGKYKDNYFLVTKFSHLLQEKKKKPAVLGNRLGLVKDFSAFVKPVIE